MHTEAEGLQDTKVRQGLLGRGRRLCKGVRGGAGAGRAGRQRTEAERWPESYRTCEQCSTARCTAPHQLLGAHLQVKKQGRLGDTDCPETGRTAGKRLSPYAAVITQPRFYCCIPAVLYQSRSSLLGMLLEAASSGARLARLRPCLLPAESGGVSRCPRRAPNTPCPFLVTTHTSYGMSICSILTTFKLCQQNTVRFLREFREGKSTVEPQPQLSASAVSQSTPRFRVTLFIFTQMMLWVGSGAAFWGCFHVNSGLRSR